MVSNALLSSPSASTVTSSSPGGRSWSWSMVSFRRPSPCRLPACPHMGSSLPTQPLIHTSLSDGHGVLDGHEVRAHDQARRLNRSSVRIGCHMQEYDHRNSRLQIE